jgi:hypothetical protein
MNPSSDSASSEEDSPPRESIPSTSQRGHTWIQGVCGHSRQLNDPHSPLCAFCTGCNPGNRCQACLHYTFPSWQRLQRKRELADRKRALGLDPRLPFPAHLKDCKKTGRLETRKRRTRQTQTMDTNPSTTVTPEQQSTSFPASSSEERWSPAPTTGQEVFTRASEIESLLADCARSPEKTSEQGDPSIDLPERDQDQLQLSPSLTNLVELQLCPDDLQLFSPGSTASWDVNFDPFTSVAIEEVAAGSDHIVSIVRVPPTLEMSRADGEPRVPAAKRVTFARSCAVELTRLQEVCASSTHTSADPTATTRSPQEGEVQRKDQA